MVDKLFGSESYSLSFSTQSQGIKFRANVGRGGDWGMGDGEKETID
jgi:hypothetical protein